MAPESQAETVSPRSSFYNNRANYKFPSDHETLPWMQLPPEDKMHLREIDPNIINSVSRDSKASGTFPGINLNKLVYD